MRRHPVIGLAVPGRKLHHRQIGREKFQRPRELLHTRTVAADDGKAHGGRFRPCRHRTGKIGDDQPLGAFGNVRKGQRATGRPAARRAI